MGRSKDLATGETRFVNTAGDTMTGNLGINEASPSGSLHVKGTSSTHGKIILEAGGSGGSANNNFMEFNKHDGTKLGELEVGESVTNGGSLVFKTTPSGGSATTRMTVNHDGNVTMPSQPYGEAEGTVGSSTSVSSGSIINWLTANHLNGGVTFSNSGRFTVPTAGRYLVHYRLYFYPSSPVSQYYQISVQKNGSEEDFMIDEEVMTTYSGSGRLDRGLSFTTVIRLAASDYLELKYHGSATGGFYRGGPHNKFKVLLLS